MPAERGPSGTGHDTACPECGMAGAAYVTHVCYSGAVVSRPEPDLPPVAVPGPASASPAEPAANCPECGRLPFGVAIGPSPTTLYLCAYCNEGARLRDEGVVVDRFSNVCHESCLAAVSDGR